MTAAVSHSPDLPSLDPQQAAKDAHLRYVHDDGPGIRRKRAGKGFTYVDDRGAVVTDADTLARIRALVIPPAWTDVWICPIAHGHIQATGRDAKGRKQYRYHARWRMVRDETKYEKMVAFATLLPKVRESVERDIALPGMPREKVLATIVRLLEVTCIRVGNEEYARKNKSFGLTTLRNRHVDVSGSIVRFRFRGKSGKEHTIRLKDRLLARVIGRCSEIPGQELFQYVDDDGQPHSVESSDVNEYLKSISGEAFTAKDFRTWVGTVLAVRALRDLTPPSSKTEAGKHIVSAVKTVAERLGNTAAVCRKCYIHPAVLDTYLLRDDWELAFPAPRAAVTELTVAATPPASVVELTVTTESELDPDEVVTLEFLRSRPSNDERAQGKALRQALRKSVSVLKLKKSRAAKAKPKGRDVPRKRKAA